MKLANARRLLEKHGTNFCEINAGGSPGFEADVNGWTIRVWQLVAEPDKCSDPTMKGGAFPEHFPGKSLTAAIRYAKRTSPVAVLESVRRDKATKEKDSFDDAVRLLMSVCDNDVILMMDEQASVYLIPAVLDEKSSDTKPPGTVEYQVSDGLPGKRGHSNDFYSLREAIAFFSRVQKVGWKKASQSPLETT